MMPSMQQGDYRDRITQALMNIQNPPPASQTPNVSPLGQGMNMPAVATPGTVASMNSQGPASPSYGGVQAMSGQPQAFPQQTQMPGATPPPSMPGSAPGVSSPLPTGAGPGSIMQQQQPGPYG